MNNVIGTYPYCNVASFNVFAIKQDYDDCVVGGINAQNIEECNEYAIEYAYFDDDGIMVDDNSGTCEAFISVLGTTILLSEIMRV